MLYPFDDGTIGLTPFFSIEKSNTSVYIIANLLKALISLTTNVVVRKKLSQLLKTAQNKLDPIRKRSYQYGGNLEAGVKMIEDELSRSCGKLILEDYLKEDNSSSSSSSDNKRKYNEFDFSPKNIERLVKEDKKKKKK